MYRASRLRESRANSSASSEPRPPIGRQKKTHNKTENRDGGQSPNNLVKQTKSSRSTVFALKGLILSENGANMVRNVLIIFIHDKLSISKVTVKVTQTTIHVSEYFIS